MTTPNGQTPAAARRVAVAACLWKERESARSLGSSPTPWAASTDDLCRLFRRVEDIGVADVALVQAAAEGSESASRLARIIYSARLTLRAAGYEQPAPHNPPKQPGRNGERGQEGSAEPARSLRAPDLASAFAALAAEGVHRVLAPRRLVDALGGRFEGRGSVGRLLVAAYSDDPDALIQALCAAPYSIDAASLRIALSTLKKVPSARDALALAVGELPGAQAKEAAVAALAALDSGRATPEGIGASMNAAAARLEAAVRSFARGSATPFEDPDVPALLEAAAHADRVWACLADAPPMDARIANLGETLAHARVADDLELIADDGTPASSVGRIEFADEESHPMAWSSLAAALEVSARGDEPKAPPAMRVTVAAALPRAVAAYLLRSDAGGDGPSAPEEAYVWPAPEAAMVFTAPPMTFSASRLNAYAICPRRWFYEYLCQVLEDPASLHAAYGRVVHDALEALHQKIRVPSDHDPASILELLLRELDHAFGRARAEFGSQLEYEVSRMRARRIAEHYVRWLAAESARAPVEIVQVELLARQRFGGHDFVGYIDRIDRPVGGGPVTILDYKTGRIDTDPRAYLEKVRRGEEAQLALYYAMRSAAGDDVARVALVSMRDPRDDVWILALDIRPDAAAPVRESKPHDGVLRVSCSRADLDASLAALVARCDQLTLRGQSHFDVGADPPCGFCAYARACRERPGDGERIFAR